MNSPINSPEIPAIEMTTGSLGHGISCAAGMALAAKISGKNWKVFCVVGDGECNEGSVWETLLFAAQQNLKNLIIIVDNNKSEKELVTLTLNTASRYIRSQLRASPQNLTAKQWIANELKA